MIVPTAIATFVVAASVISAFALTALVGCRAFLGVAVLVVAAVASTATVVVTTALLAALATITAAAVVTTGALIVTGYAGFATVLTTLVPAIFTGSLVLVAALFGLCFFITEEASDLATQTAEQAFFLLLGLGGLLCRCRGRRARADGLNSGLFASRALRSRCFKHFFLAHAVFLGHLVAGNVLGRGFVLTHSQNFEMRCFHVRNRYHNHAHFLACFNVGQLLALLVQQEGRYGDRNNGTNFAGLLLGGLFVDQAHDAQCQRLDATNSALAFTARADFAAGLAQ